MNTSIGKKLGSRGKFVAVGAMALVLVACANTPPTPDGAVAVRQKLTALQNNPNLNSLARVEIREAEQAVRLAETPVAKKETAVGEHRVYMAERKVAIAEATAAANYAVAQRVHLGEERDAARLQARTMEADRARGDANRAEASAERLRDAADQARIDEAQASSASATKAAELQRRITELEAEATERGLVLTLGDVLFSTGSAVLRGDSNAKLNKVVDFLNEYPERQLVIEGHTDNTGSADYNQTLSQQRADSVRAYMAQKGIASARMSSVGMGMGNPISSNDDSTGRQQNRRVEIIIEHAAAS